MFDTREYKTSPLFKELYHNNTTVMLDFSPPLPNGFLEYQIYIRHLTTIV